MEAPRSGARALLGGRYELGDVLGLGGMGEVREARDERLGRVVAVKLMRGDLAASDSARRRFESEARAAARLAHPNVVTVFDSGEDDGIPFLVMERLPGRTLTEELAQGPLPVARVCELASEILAALTAAHQAGVLHRDVKPGNVLLTEDGHAKVADFGIAKLAESGDETVTGELVATPVYLAPERFSGAPASPQSDIYSVGVVLYEALTRQRPYAGTTPLGLLRAIESGDHQPLGDVRPDLPPRIVATVERAMARKPEDRFGTAAEMAAALGADDTQPVTVTRSPETEPMPSPVVGPEHDGSTRTLLEPAPRPAPAPAPRPARLPRARRRAPEWLRGPRAAVLAALVAVIVFVLLVVALGGNGENPTTGSEPTVTSAPPARTPASSPLPAPLDRSIRRLERSVSP